MNQSMRFWLAALVVATCQVAPAQQPETQPGAERAVVLDLPAEPLEDALREFSRVTGLKVMFLTELGRGIISPKVAGTLTPAAALERLLKRAGLRFKYLDDQTIAVFQAEDTKSNSALRPMSRNDTETLRNGSDAAGGSDASGNSAAIQSGQALNSAGDAEGIPNDGLQEVVVTAQKREERLQNVPISISVLGGRELDRSTYQGVSEALSAVPGVAITENYLGGGTSVVIRGVQAASPLFTGSSAVAYYLDSVPFGLIRSAVAPDQSAYDLERVEVLRGPQGTLYGASALNGVVRVLSSDPDLQSFDLKARTGVSGSMYGGANYRGDLAVNVPILDGILAARAVVGYENDSGWIDQVNQGNVNDAELRNYRLKLKAQPTADLSIVLSAWSSRDNYGAPSFGYTFNKSASLLDQPIVTDFDAYGLNIQDSFAGISVTSSTSYLDYKNQGSLDLVVYQYPNSIFFSGLWSNIFSQELNFSSPREGAWRWSFGGIYTRGTENVAQSYTEIGVPTETVLMTSKSHAEYGELTRLFFHDRVEVTAGLRHYQDEVAQLGQLAPDTPYVPERGSFGANTPRGVITWHATERLMAYASYSQGFRSGFPQDAAVPAGYAPVNPDRLRNYELGSKGSLLGGLLSYDTSVYYMKWNDIQQQLYVPYAGVPAGAVAVINAQSASGVGIDFALIAQPITGLTLKLNGSWNNLGMDKPVLSGGVVLFRTGDRPNFSPETTAGLSADYEFGLGHGGYSGDLSASLNYVSQQSYRALQDAGLPDAYPLVQAGEPMTTGRVSFSVSAPAHWTARLYVDNVNNERGSPIDAFSGVPNWASRIRPRTAGLQVDYQLR